MNFEQKILYVQTMTECLEVTKELLHENSHSTPEQRFQWNNLACTILKMGVKMNLEDSENLYYPNPEEEYEEEEHHQQQQQQQQDLVPTVQDDIPYVPFGESNSLDYIHKSNMLLFDPFNDTHSLSRSAVEEKVADFYHENNLIHRDIKCTDIICFNCLVWPPSSQIVSLQLGIVFTGMGGQTIDNNILLLKELLTHDADLNSDPIDCDPGMLSQKYVIFNREAKTHVYKWVRVGYTNVLKFVKTPPHCLKNNTIYVHYEV